MQHDIIASALSSLMNAENVSKESHVFGPASRLLISILHIMQEAHYIGGFETKEDARGKMVKINLIGSLNRCGVITPRFSVRAGEYERYEKQFLPAKDMGILIVSTSKGVMPHTESKAKNLGGKLIAYVY